MRSPGFRLSCHTRTRSFSDTRWDPTRPFRHAALNSAIRSGGQLNLSARACTIMTLSFDRLRDLSLERLAPRTARKTCRKAARRSQNEAATQLGQLPADLSFDDVCKP